jgi:hypothetical protein
MKEATMRCSKISLITVCLLAGLVSLRCAPQRKAQLMPAEYDLSKYETLAVADFHGPSDQWAKRFSSWLEEDLKKLQVEGKPYFKVVPRSELYRVLENQNLQLSQLANPEISLQVGRLLGLDAIITGVVIEAHTDEWIYSHWRPNVILTAHVNFTAQVISTRTGRVVVDETVSKKKEIDVTGPSDLADLEYQDEPLTSCAREAVQIFVRKITPDYVIQ